MTATGLPPMTATGFPQCRHFSETCAAIPSSNLRPFCEEPVRISTMPPFCTAIPNRRWQFPHQMNQERLPPAASAPSRRTLPTMPQTRFARSNAALALYLARLGNEVAWM